MYRFYIAFALSALVVFIGCGQDSRPKDLPKLYPCELTFTQEGKPLDVAMVELVSVDADAKYRPASITDADGKVSMSTYGFSGVPVGKYKVVVSKQVDDDLVYGLNSAGEQEVKSSKKYRLVEEQYSSAKTTPLEMDITGKEKNVIKTFDVGKAVKTKL